MNSLYGRFGMNTNLDVHKIVNNQELQGLQRKFGRLTLQVEISKDLFLVSHAKPTDTSGHNFWNAEDIPNVNIAVAASIPAYARTVMNVYLADPEYIIGYIDTDCIF